MRQLKNWIGLNFTNNSKDIEFYAQYFSNSVKVEQIKIANQTLQVQKSTKYTYSNICVRLDVLI